MMLYLDYDGLKRYHNLSLNEFVFRESGKGLSTNDYTDAEKTKLAGISENATNVTESTISEWGFIKSSATALTNKADLVDGVVPSDQLPSFVDDIVEFNKISSSAPATCSKGDYYYNNISNKIYKATDTDTWGATAYNPEKSKIYFDKNELKSYRWSGSTMLEIHDTISIGTSTGTAADGKIVNDHVNASNPHSGSQSKITAVGILKSDGNGNISSAIVGDDYLAPLAFNTTPTNSNKVATMSDIPSWALQPSRPDYSFNDLITHPTTIFGYGITDAKIENGTITLGSSTITPLTSSSLNDYATLSWVGNQGFASQSSLSHYLALTGGTMENTIITPGSDDYGIYPESDRSGFIGKNTNWYWKIYGSLLYSEKMELYNYNNEGRSLYGGIDNNNFYLYPGTNSYKFNVNEFGYVTALKFTKEGGTSSQFLKADGSVDSNTYLTSLSLTNYVLKSNTTGLLKNDGTIDSNSYLTSSSLNDYATKQWVGLGYVPNSAISDMATKTWVGEQDFVSFDSQGDISLQGDVNAGIFNATGGFKKSGSSDSYVLLAGGGTKPLTDFATSSDGKVTSVAMSVPTGFQIGGSPITTSGTLALSFSSGYALPTTSDVSKGVTAYGWGDHSQAGYTTQSTNDSRYLKLSGGTMTGSIILPADDNKGIIPTTDNYGQIGSASKKFYRIYTNSLNADSVIIRNGTSSLFLKADGTLDSNTYLTSVSWSTVTGKPDTFTPSSHTHSEYLGINDTAVNSSMLGGTDANSYATKSWVGNLGFLTSSSLTNYILKSSTTGLLKNNGTVDTNTYLTSSSISDMATKTWVGNQKYISENSNGNIEGEWNITTRYDIESTTGDIKSTLGSIESKKGFKKTGSDDNSVLLAGGGTKALSDFITSSGGTLTSALQAFPYTISNSTYYRIKVEDAGITINNRRLFMSNSYLQITNSGGGSVTQQADGDTYKFTANPNSGGQSGVTSFLFNKKITAADGFAKTGSSDSEVLLGGGGTKALMDFLETSGGTVTGTIRMSQLNKLMFGYNNSPNYIQFDANDDALYFHGGPDGFVFETTDSQGDANFRCNIYANNVNNNSDARLKDIVSHAGFEVDKLATLPLVWFTWKKDERRRMHFGSIAQEWQKVLPEVVSENGDGMLAMDYGAAAMAAGVTACREIVEMKELMKTMLEEIKILKEEIEELKRR